MNSLFNRALLEVGQNGKFQKKFDLLYNVLLAALWPIAFNSIILVLTTVPHICQLPERPGNISEFKWRLEHIPIIKNDSGNVIFSSCLIYNSTNNESMECDSYDYDQTWYKSTVPSQYNWVCNKQLYVANIFAYTKVAETVGSLFFGWFGDTLGPKRIAIRVYGTPTGLTDYQKISKQLKIIHSIHTEELYPCTGTTPKIYALRYGRKLTYIISLTLLITGRFLSLLSNRWVALFTLGCVIASFPATSALQSISVISIEISSPERRSTIAKLRLVSTSIGMCILPILYWLLKDWKSFLLVTTVTQLPYLALSWMIIESPEWLWINRKTKACVKELRHIAKGNGTELDHDTEKEIVTATPQTTKKEVLGALTLFSSRNLAINTILQMCMWVSVTMSYIVSLIRSGEQSDGNPFLEFAWQSLAEVPAHFIAAWLADNLGRRYTGVTSCGLTAILWTLLGLRELSSSAWIRSGFIGTLLAIISRLSITISYYIINLFNMELYPTCLRQSGMSVGDVISGGASAVAPYVHHLGHQYGFYFSAAILTFNSLLGVASSFFLPETLNVKLPETLEDAREFGKRNSSEYVSVELNSQNLS